MDDTQRARALWGLFTLTAAYALVNIVIYYTTSRFGPAWFATSVIIYGLLIAIGVVLAVRDQPARNDREVVYRSDTGHLVRTTHVRREGRAVSYTAVTHDAVRSIDQIEAAIDGWPAARGPAPLTAVAAAIDERIAQPLSPSIPLEEVSQ